MLLSEGAMINSQHRSCYMKILMISGFSESPTEALEAVHWGLVRHY